MAPPPSQPDDNGNGDKGDGNTAVEPQRQEPAAMTLMKKEPMKRSRGSSTSTMDEKSMKRKKLDSTASSTWAMVATPSLSGGDADGEGQQQQQPGEKPQRFVWTQERHLKFVKVCNSLGKEAVPKKILEKMNIPGLTRENVASHLQKYRMSSKREEKQIPGNRGAQQLRRAQSATQTPSPATSSQRQTPSPATSSLHPLASHATHSLSLLDSQPQRGHDQLHQTPQLSSSDIANFILARAIEMPQNVQGVTQTTITRCPEQNVQALASQAMNPGEGFVYGVNMGKMSIKVEEEQGCAGLNALSSDGNAVQQFWANNEDPISLRDIYTPNKTN